MVMHVDELGHALGKEQALLKVLGGTGHETPNISTTLSAMRNDAKVSMQVHAGKGVTLEDFTRIFQHGVPGSPPRSAASMAMRRAGRLAYSVAAFEDMKRFSPGSRKTTFASKTRVWVQDAPRARGLLFLSAFAALSYVASMLHHDGLADLQLRNRALGLQPYVQPVASWLRTFLRGRWPAGWSTRIAWRS